MEIVISDKTIIDFTLHYTFYDKEYGITNTDITGTTACALNGWGSAEISGYLGGGDTTILYPQGNVTFNSSSLHFVITFDVNYEGNPALYAAVVDVISGITRPDGKTVVTVPRYKKSVYEGGWFTETTEITINNVINAEQK